VRRQRLYVDTSVIGGCEDTEFRSDSRALLAQARRGAVLLLVSPLLLRELAEAPAQVQRWLLDLPPDSVELLIESEEAVGLRDAYLRARVVTSACTDDAMHVALATVYGADLVVSWNFRHIVHVDRIRAFNAVNLREGYGLIDIRSPQEVV